MKIPSRRPLRAADAESAGAAVAATGFRTPSQRFDRVWGRALRIGLAGAVGIHLAALLLSRTVRIEPAIPFTAAGPPHGDPRAAAGGGGGMEMVEVRIARSAPERAAPVPTPLPVPAPEVVVAVELEERPAPLAEDPGPEVAVTLPGTDGEGQGGESGSATGPGTASGSGFGGGGTGEEGGAGLVLPTPRGMILPPADRPAAARGQEITVWVFITDRGRVVPDSTRLEPPTPDRRYNDRLRRSAAEWVFEPARRAGRAVAAWYPFQIIL